MFSPELRSRAEELVGRYPDKRSALLPLLHLVQHADGHISDDGVAECAELLAITKAEVGAVATFYTMYKRAPMGRHLVSVCTSFSCAVRGGKEVYDRLSAKLGVGHNETTEDGAITLEHAECLGNCEGAPLVTVDYSNYECLAPADAESLVDQVAGGDGVPPPTRGEVPPGIREASYRLAGLGPLSDADGDIAEAVRAARGHHGGLTPARQAEAGPGHLPVGIVPTFSEADEAERQRAKQEVRGAGMDPYAVEEAAGASAREFPTRDPDWEPRAAGTAPGSEAVAPDPDPRGTPDPGAEGEDADRGETEGQEEREARGKTGGEGETDGQDNAEGEDVRTDDEQAEE